MLTEALKTKEVVTRRDCEHVLCSGVIYSPAEAEATFCFDGAPKWESIWSAVETRIRADRTVSVDHANNIDADTFHICSA